MPPGNIIFLNGTSSSGKTTLAYALQETLLEPYMHVALDQFRDGLPARYRGLNASIGTTGALGLNVIPVNDAETPYTDIQFGVQGKMMLRGMRRAMASMVEAGNNILIDDIILENEFLDDYIEVFRPFNVLFVGVKCPKDVINKRESGRPGRFPGTAIGHYEICHAHDNYDVAVDTSTMSPFECAARITQQQKLISEDSQYISAFHQLNLTKR
ncbi:MAG: chloramphenicol 3-O phosphotransferase [Candidatus Azotimanducaceae bacterium]|jgi:chloramphenicol 3-O phosphotransferase